MYTQQVGYGSVAGWCPHCWCRYHHHTYMCHTYHVKHTSKQFNLKRLKSGLKRDANETPTCAMPVHATQTKALWPKLVREEGGTTKALCILCQGVWGLGICGC